MMAQNALTLLYGLASYFAGHAALRANGCLEVLVTAVASSDVTRAQYAVWAIQSLTGIYSFTWSYAISGCLGCPFCQLGLALKHL